MLLRYFYNPKLAHASYLVGCQQTGEAIVVDPGRDVEPYLREARSQGLRLVAVTETHIHADFVSGARELADRVGAKLCLSDEGGAGWRYGAWVEGYPHQRLHDGDRFHVGNIRFEVLHVPGHTPEHIALLLTDTAGADQPMGIFTGDFVFVGSVGRPDLLQAVAGEQGSADALARQMAASLTRFKALPDFIQVWPAHGAGSACGKGLGAIPSSTVGYERLFNWALREEDEDAFVAELLAGQPEAPPYFARMKRVNRDGPTVLGSVLTLPLLPAARLADLLQTGATVIDTRPAQAFSAGHIPGTLNVPANDAFLTWMGWLAPGDAPFYLIGDPTQADALMRDLSTIGLEHAAGFFDAGSIQAAQMERYAQATPEAMAGPVARGEVTLVDVRARSEWDEGHIPQAQHLMLGLLPDGAAALPTDKPLLMQCRSGARSAIAASLLQARGAEVINLAGGIEAWQAAGLPVETSSSERNGNGIS